MKNISGSGRVSGTRWSLITTPLAALYIVFTTYHQVADKLGKPASRVRLCIGGSSALGSGIVGESSIVGSRSGASSILSFDGGRTSESVSNMALVEGGSLAVRFSALSVLHTL